MTSSETAAEILSNLIVRRAFHFVGLRETEPNREWNDPLTPGPDSALAVELRSMMRSAPWKEGWAYCAAFCEGVVTDALVRSGAAPAVVRRFQALMSPHVLTSAANFRKAKLLRADPVFGAIWLAQHGVSQNGHSGIVTATGNLRQMSTIEANTSLDSSNPTKDREGDWITTRVFNPAGRGTLRTLGFVHPADLLHL